VYLELITPCKAQPPVNDFRREIPTMVNGEPDLFYALSQQKAQQLKLGSLENGFEDIQIRIWYDFAASDKRTLLILKNTKGLWHGTFYEMYVAWNSTDLSEKIRNSKSQSVKPSVGWDELMPAILELGIGSLPNMEDIPGISDGFKDGVTYCVEYATSEQYRFYCYHVPERFPDFHETRQMAAILNLIQQTFQLPNE